MTTRRGILAVVIAAVFLVSGLGLALGVGQAVEPAPDLAAPTERDALMAWLARVLLVLAAAWVLIGMLSARTRLVRRPGAAAARASWLAATRPWRARESTLGMLELDRWLLMIVPAALLVGTRAVQTSFDSWPHLAVVLGAWTAAAIVMRSYIWERSPWPIMAAVGGAVVLRCIVTLCGLAVAGPAGYWTAFWTMPLFRTLSLAVGFALFAWAFVAAGWALSAQVSRKRATGYVLASAGAGLLAPAVVVGWLGLADVIRAGGETGLLPWQLAENLGLTGGSAASLPWIAAGVGAVLVVIGVVLAPPHRRAAASIPS